MSQYWPLWSLGSDPLVGNAGVRLCTHTHTHTHIFHPAVDGHLGCFCILATATNPAVNMECRYGFKIVHLGWITEVGFQDDMAILFSIFRGPPILFSTVDTSTYILTGRVQGFPFLQSCQCCWSLNFLTTATVVVWGGGFSNPASAAHPLTFWRRPL